MRLAKSLDLPGQEVIENYRDYKEGKQPVPHLCHLLEAAETYSAKSAEHEWGSSTMNNTAIEKCNCLAPDTVSDLFFISSMVHHWMNSSQNLCVEVADRRTSPIDILEIGAKSRRKKHKMLPFVFPCHAEVITIGRNALHLENHFISFLKNFGYYKASSQTSFLNVGHECVTTQSIISKMDFLCLFGHIIRVDITIMCKTTINSDPLTSLEVISSTVHGPCNIRQKTVHDVFLAVK